MVVEPNDEERGKIMSNLATAITALAGRLLREDVAARSDESTIISVANTTILVTMTDGRQVRLVVEEV